MVEFSERMFYKTRFNVEALNEGDDLLWKIVLHIKIWMTRKYNNLDEVIVPESNNKWTSFKNGGRIFSEDNSNVVYMESDLYQDEAKTCWACKISERGHAKEGFAVRNWTTQIGIEIDKGKCALFSCVISYNDSVSFIGPTDDIPRITIPRIIRNMIEDPTLYCFFGCDEITVAPHRIENGSCSKLWSRLADASRTLPYFILGPCPTIKENDEMLIVNAVNANDLAECLCGNAIVYFTDSYEVLNEIKGCFPLGYDCPLGTMRIYYPGIDTIEPNASNKHRFFGKTYVDSIGEKEFLRILRRVFAQDLHYSEDKDYIIIDYCKKLHRKQNTQQKIEETRQKLIQEHKTELSEQENKMLDDWMKEAQEKEFFEKKAENLEKENDKLKSEKHTLREKLNNYKSAAIRLNQMESALKARENMSYYPSNKEKIIKYFSTVFNDRIAFSEETLKSIKTCTISNDDLWKAFYSLATDMFEIMKNGYAKPYEQFKLQTGIECAAGEGGQTHKDSKIMQTRQVLYNGEIASTEPHLKFRDCSQRIYFGMLNDGRVVVGHCGEHLDTAGTRRRK